MSLLSKNSLPAEIQRGCLFSELFESSAKVALNRGTITGILTFPNDFLNLAQLLPTFPGSGKVRHNPTFQLFPPIYRGKVKKLDGHRFKSQTCVNGVMAILL